MKKIVQKIVLAGVVTYKGKILIVQRSSDDEAYPSFWELPSGKRDFLEPSRQALIREIKEETGIGVEPTTPIDVFEFKVEKENEIRDATQISFLCKPVGKPNVKLSNEHQNFVWISENEIGQYELSKETREAIQKAFDLIK